MSNVIEIGEAELAQAIKQSLLEKSKEEQAGLFEIARDLFTPLELNLLFGWEVPGDNETRHIDR